MKDLIRRKDILDLLRKYAYRHKIASEDYFYLLNDVYLIPTVEIGHIRKSRWVLSKNGNIMCPVCGNEPYHENRKDMNYCPKCGAKMGE